MNVSVRTGVIAVIKPQNYNVILQPGNDSKQGLKNGSRVIMWEFNRVFGVCCSPVNLIITVQGGYTQIQLHDKPVN